jgi:hypothetical protein
MLATGCRLGFGLLLGKEVLSYPNRKMPPIRVGGIFLLG